MKIKYCLLILFIFTARFYSQGRTYIYDSFTAKIEDASLRVYDKDKRLVVDKKFTDPYDFSVDLDDDGVDEYLVVDDIKKDEKDFYIIYIFNTGDSFYLADSISSGYLEPYKTNSEEAGGTIIVTGNPKFDSLNSSINNDAYIPVNCWQYKSGKISLANNKIYKLFVAENDTMLDVIDAYYDSNGSDCKSTGIMKGLIASVYANYMHSGDKLLATQFLRRYYHCDDLEDFRKKINSLL
jgi:hypothetical protein